MYKKGMGGERNIYRAADLYRKAVMLGGGKDAQRRLNALRKEYRERYRGE
jgi:TPR repeat protein